MRIMSLCLSMLGGSFVGRLLSVDQRTVAADCGGVSEVPRRHGQSAGQFVVICHVLGRRGGSPGERQHDTSAVCYFCRPAGNQLD